ncbi:hypothetical protein DFS34DRAFT_2435 [Phlyctochytrium arcticum]|nr:hypothetical protein DFS34DRAFT_2435 [Phlyctochytrium arcticum]
MGLLDMATTTSKQQQKKNSIELRRQSKSFSDLRMSFSSMSRKQQPSSDDQPKSSKRFMGSFRTVQKRLSSLTLSRASPDVFVSAMGSPSEEPGTLQTPTTSTVTIPPRVTPPSSPHTHLYNYHTRPPPLRHASSMQSLASLRSNSSGSVGSHVGSSTDALDLTASGYPMVDGKRAMASNGPITFPMAAAAAGPGRAMHHPLSRPLTVNTVHPPRHYRSPSSISTSSPTTTRDQSESSQRHYQPIPAHGMYLQALEASARGDITFAADVFGRLASAPEFHAASQYALGVLYTQGWTGGLFSSDSKKESDVNAREIATQKEGSASPAIDSTSHPSSTSLSSLGSSSSAGSSSSSPNTSSSTNNPSPPPSPLIHLSTPQQAALHYFSLAAAQGHPPALCNLGVLYATGLFLSQPPNRPLAISYFRQAAGKGHKEAMCNLGRLVWEDGQRGEARVWFMRAIQRGCVEAKWGLERLEAELAQEARIAAANTTTPTPDPTAVAC